MKKITLLLVLIMSSLVYGQNTGSISGLLFDKQYDEPLAFANVLIKGTTKGTTSDFDGNYELSGLSSGSYTIIFTFVGYKNQEHTVSVVNGKVTKLDINMEPTAASLDEVVVRVSTKKESVTALLTEQKKAVEIKTAIGAEELAAKAVSDAGAATLKVTGVNKTEGSSSIYVRGLGDRYNGTTLNGLPLPSNDPTNKNIDLSLFSSGIIRSVGISKAFSSYMSLDVAGANIDVLSKETTEKSFLKIGVSTGVNTQSTLKRFQRIDGTNFVGVNTDTQHNIRNLADYNFDTSFTPENGLAAPNSSLSLNAGRRFKLTDESNLSFFLVGSFSNKHEFRDGFKNNVIGVDANGLALVGTAYDNAETFIYNASKMLMGNVAYKINSNHKVSYNHLFVHSNTQSIQDFVGTTTEIGRSDTDNRLVNDVLQKETQNRLFVNQILSSHKFGEGIDLNSGLAYSAIFSDEPDRRRNSFIIDIDNNTTRLSQNAVRDNGRFYGNLFEDNVAGRLDVVKYLGGDRSENKGKVTLGYNGFVADRKYDGIFFDHNLSDPRNSFVTGNLDAIFNQENLTNGVFGIETPRGRNANDPETYLPLFYDGTKNTHAAFIDATYNFGDKFTANVGLRAEDVKMQVSWNTSIGLPGFSAQGNIDLDRQYFLPAFNLKYKLNDKINFRGSGSVTYTYPQFKEIAPFPYEEINSRVTGNPALLPSDNYNAELKFEMFPNKTELLSVGVFGKLIQNAINRLEAPSAVENDFTFENVGDATVLGLELEGRLDLVSIVSDDDDKSQNLSLGGNATLMHTELEFTNTDRFNLTNDSSQLEGASPLTINADLSYKFNLNDRVTTSTLVFNYQSDKVYTIGANFKENIVEKAVPLLDFVFKHSFNEKLSLKFNAKNILNPRFERFRDVPQELTRSSYRKGTTLSVGVNYSL